MIFVILILAVIAIILSFIIFNKTREEQYTYKGVCMPSLGSSLIPDSYLPEGFDVSSIQPQSSLI